MRSALQSVDGVQSAKVSMPDKAVVFFGEAEANPAQHLATLIAAVEKAGYTAKQR